MKHRVKSINKQDLAEYVRLFQAVKRVGYNSLTPKDQALFSTLYEMQTGKKYTPPGAEYLSKQTSKKVHHVKMIKQERNGK